MDSQDKFFKDSIKQIHENRDAKEENFEMLQQQERAKVAEQQKKNTNPSSNDDCRKRYTNLHNPSLFCFPETRVTKLFWFDSSAELRSFQAS